MGKCLLFFGSKKWKIYIPVHGHLRYTVTQRYTAKNIIDNAILGLYRFVTASHNGTRNKKNNVHLRF